MAGLPHFSYHGRHASERAAHRGLILGAAAPPARNADATTGYRVTNISFISRAITRYFHSHYTPAWRHEVRYYCHAMPSSLAACYQPGLATLARQFQRVSHTTLQQRSSHPLDGYDDDARDARLHASSPRLCIICRHDEMIR